MRGELTPRQVYTRFKRFLKSIGLGRCSIEGLRHSWATLAIGAGAALADVSVTMGHTTTKMVMEHYLMSTRAIAKRAIDAAGKAIGACMEVAGAAQLSLGRFRLHGVDAVSFEKTSTGSFQIQAVGMNQYFWFDKKKGIGIWDNTEKKKNYICKFNQIG